MGVCSASGEVIETMCQSNLAKNELLFGTGGGSGTLGC